jgi:hypothetical protein
MRINQASSKDIPDSARKLSPSYVGGFWDPATVVYAKQPLFALVTNSNDDPVVCTLKADIKDKDEDNEWSVQLGSRGSYVYVYFGTSTNPSSDGTYEWTLDASTSGWKQVSVQFIIL